jgi:site-specific DNA recombinase
MESKTAAIWGRVSSAGQSELSLDGQVQRVKTKLESLGYTVPPEFIFQVVWTSLDLESCSEFQQLRQLVRSKKINAVGFLDRDRLEAKGLQRLIFLSDCKENEVEPIVYQGSSFISEPEGSLLELALAIGKERSVKRAQSGAKQGLQDRARLKGLPPTKAGVYGMKWENGKFAPDENYSNVSLVWNLALSGMNLKRICKQLVSRGIPTPRGKVYWQPSTLQAILTNPVYAGRLGTLRYEKVNPKIRRKNTFGKTSFRIKPIEQWHFIDDLVEQSVVPWKQWLTVQERLELNRLYASRNAKRKYLLRGLIECQACYNQGIQRHYYGVKRSHQEPAYVCSAGWAQTHGKRCPSKPIPLKEIEEGAKAETRNFLERPTIYLAEIRDRIGITDKTIQDIQKAIGNNKKQYGETIIDERDARNRLSPEAFEQEQKLLLAKRTWLKEENETLVLKLANLQKYDVKQEMVEKMKQNLQANLDRASDDDWRFIFESLGVKIMAFADGSWDIEISVPVPDTPIENKIPWCTCPWLHPGTRLSPKGCQQYDRRPS